MSNLNETHVFLELETHSNLDTPPPLTPTNLISKSQNDFDFTAASEIGNGETSDTRPPGIDIAQDQPCVSNFEGASHDPTIITYREDSELFSAWTYRFWLRRLLLSKMVNHYVKSKQVVIGEHAH